MRDGEASAPQRTIVTLPAMNSQSVQPDRCTMEAGLYVQLYHNHLDLVHFHAT